MSKPYQINTTREAARQLQSLPARHRSVVESGILKQLQDQPTATSKAIKRLRLNPFAELELRVEDFRVLYNVDEANKEVLVLAVGRKVGNKLIVEGEEFHGHESHPPA